MPTTRRIWSRGSSTPTRPAPRCPECRHRNEAGARAMREGEASIEQGLVAEDAPRFIEATGLVKSYGAVHALKSTDFHLGDREVVGLIGHNGAGKSTLINVLTGTVEQLDGELRVEGSQVAQWSPLEAQRSGLRCVFQELSLCATLTAVENTRLVHRSLRGRRWKTRAAEVIHAALDSVFPGSGVPLNVPMGELSLGQRQMVEIARGFSETDERVRAIILDEPTSSLGPAATQQLLDHIRAAAARGIASILVTHRLNEILAVSDRVVTMKDGIVVSDVPNRGLTRGNLVAAMGNIETVHRRRESGRLTEGPPIVRHEAGPEDQSIELRPGEIVGFAGLDGHSQRERLRAIFDEATPLGAPIAFVAGDRVVEGVFPLWSIRDNLVIRSLDGLSRAGVISAQRADDLARAWFDKMKVRAPDIATPLLSLSGGNQQKVLFARALASEARIIVLDDPMRGVEVGTKQDVYELIKAEAEQGRSFLWYSTELEELENCDRVHVFRENRVVAAFAGGEIEQNRILQASFGAGHG